jgi:hypothetical protein
MAGSVDALALPREVRPDGGGQAHGGVWRGVRATAVDGAAVVEARAAAGQHDGHCGRDLNALDVTHQVVLSKSAPGGSTAAASLYVSDVENQRVDAYPRAPVARH